MSSRKNERWVSGSDAMEETAGAGVVRKVLAYGDSLMCVENVFGTGTAGALHSHPHTQITYVLSGVFAYSIAGEKRIIRQGDSTFVEGGVEHGCECLEAGALLDAFAPMREDFVINT